MASIIDRLATASGTVASALALTVGGIAVAVRVRRLPLRAFAVDALPMLLVAYSQRPEESRLFDTGPDQDVWYSLQLVILAAADRAIAGGTGSSDETILTARQTLRRAFQRPALVIAAGVTELLMTEVRPDAPLARGKWAQNHDASGITVRFRCQEPASA